MGDTAESLTGSDDARSKHPGADDAAATKESKPWLTVRLVAAIWIYVALTAVTAGTSFMWHNWNTASVQRAATVFAMAELGHLDRRLDSFFGDQVRVRDGVRDALLCPGVMLPMDAPDPFAHLKYLSELTLQGELTPIDPSRPLSGVQLSLVDGNYAGADAVRRPTPTATTPYRDIVYSWQIYTSNDTRLNATHPCCGVGNSRIIDFSNGRQLSSGNQYTDLAPLASSKGNQLFQLAVGVFKALGPSYSSWTGPILSSYTLEETLDEPDNYQTHVGAYNASGVFMGLVTVSRSAQDLSRFLEEAVARSTIIDAVVLTDGRVVLASSTDDVDRVVTNAADDEYDTNVGNTSVAGNCRISSPSSSNLPRRKVCNTWAHEFGYAPLQAASKAGVLGTVADSTRGGKRGAVIVAELDVDGAVYLSVSSAYDVMQNAGPSGFVLTVFFKDADIQGDRVRTSTFIVIIAGGVALVAIVVAVAASTLVLSPVSEVAAALRATARLGLDTTAVGHTLPDNAVREIYDLQVALRDTLRLTSVFGAYVPRDLLGLLSMGVGTRAADGLRPVTCAVLCADVPVVSDVAIIAGFGDATRVVGAALDAMTTAVRQTRGSVVSCWGDCVVATWGCLYPCPNMAIRAVIAALLLERSGRAGPLAQAMDAAGTWTRPRVGVAVGSAQAGVLQRWSSDGPSAKQASASFTVVGDVVNNAYRMQARASALDTRPLVTDSVAKAKAVAKLFVLHSHIVFGHGGRGGAPVYAHTFGGDLDAATGSLQGPIPASAASFESGRPASPTSSQNTGGPKVVFAVAHEVAGLVPQIDPNDVLTVRRNDATSPGGRAEEAAGMVPVADDATDRGTHGSPTAAMLDLTAGFVDAPLQASEADVQLSQALRRIVRAYQRGMLRTSLRRAEHLLARLPERHPAATALSATFEALKRMGDGWRP